MLKMTSFVSYNENPKTKNKLGKRQTRVKVKVKVRVLSLEVDPKLVLTTSQFYQMNTCMSAVATTGLKKKIPLFPFLLLCLTSLQVLHISLSGFHIASLLFSGKKFNRSIRITRTDSTQTQ